MSDGSIVGGGSVASVVGDGGAPAGARGRCQRSGFRVYVLVAAKSGGLWQGQFEERAKTDDQHGAEYTVLALMLAKVTVAPLDSPVTMQLQQRLRDAALAETRRATVQGFLEYEIDTILRLESPFPLATEPVRAGAVLELLGDEFGSVSSPANPSATPYGRAIPTFVQECGDAHRPLLRPECAALDADLASRISQGHSRQFHCVALGARVNRKRLIVEDDAPRKFLKRARMDLPAAPEVRLLREKRWRGSQGVLRDPKVVLLWLDIARHLKQQRMAPAVCKSFANLFSQTSGIPKEKLLKGMLFLSAKTLVTSRIRADCTAMLLHRQWWQMVQTRDDVNVYIFADASPQWRGIELYAVTIDIVLGGKLIRRLAPLVALSKTQLDLSGKLVALLWQMYLMIGSWSSLKRFCQCVRSVTTDMGTERLLADSADSLREFFSTAFPTEPLPNDAPGNFLFENALHMPGFRHMLDNIIQRGLSSMRSFPGFLEKLKAIVRFLRNELVLDEVCRCLQRDGFDGLAAVLRKAKLTTFANWRWGTLAAVTKVLDTFISSLA